VLLFGDPERSSTRGSTPSHFEPRIPVIPDLFKYPVDQAIRLSEFHLFPLDKKASIKNRDFLKFLQKGGDVFADSRSERKRILRLSVEKIQEEMRKSRDSFRNKEETSLREAKREKKTRSQRLQAQNAQGPAQNEALHEVA
jgi:hypothetical protein